MADLLINNKDAYAIWGVRMGDGFLDKLGEPSSMKEFVENKSRLEHGKRVVIDNPKVDERDLTLTFTIEGRSESDFHTKKVAFYEELYKGKVDIQVPASGNEIYHLIYLGKSASYAQSIDRTFGKVVAKFNEPNPSSEGRK